MHDVTERVPTRALRTTQIHPVLLSGGAGTRLWPLSRAIYPKQFLALTSDRTLLQETASRALGDAGFADPIVICNEEHRFMIHEQLHGIGIEPQSIILESAARNTAPAIAAVALWLLDRDPDALMLAQPCDHLIGALPDFYLAVAKGVPAAQAGHLVTFGVVPDKPETGYGYIRVGAPLGAADGVRAVEHFAEKPDTATAERYVASGNYLWNSGIFLMSAKQYVAELERLQPDMLTAVREAIAAGKEDNGFFRLDEAAFSAAASLSIDHAVMEHTEKAAVIPVEMAWCDVGSWQSLWGVSHKDEAGNVEQGDVILQDVKNSYVHSDGRLVAAIGVEDLVIVATDDAVLVADAAHAKHVGKVVEQLRRRNRSEETHHTTVYRPWGYYRAVDIGYRFQVKRIMVKPGARLSLQKHHHRAEHWIVVQGTALVQRDGEDRLVRENESVHIPIGTEHRLENPGKLPLHLIEVQSGAYLGEDDIVRLSDSYGRA
ncbi:MAG: mannose-1-phosphate guanylyltransferase/mannose-6-phosphate isomerase [Azospirillaceae bacterium]|nr:mannose-1-phosphate guanylyltransferase/mannose-6-phosphate isomerase [Azospirillaceae bacterium]